MDLGGVCHTRFHSSVPKDIFFLLSCTTCFTYLFPKNTELKQRGPVLQFTNTSKEPKGTIIIPDVTNSSSVREICNTLDTDDDCDRWTDCCQAAIKCCQEQIATPVLYNNTPYCPRIWDGYGCFGDTLPGVLNTITCPSYIEHGVTHATAYKQCTDNGTWFVNPETNMTWTDYTKCVPLEHPLILVYVSLACNIISLLLLCPSCAVFLSFKQLRSQNRIKLHICFFVSFILVSVIAIMWDFMVHHNRLNNMSGSLVDENTHGCKLLYTLLLYTQTSNYFWMFCEGFYLHRLIVHAFNVPKGLLGYYVIGWGVSAVPIAIYSVIRATNQQLNKRCWVADAGNYDWIIYIPNLLCLFLNVVFFVNILRILLTQLQSHPNEPSNYRRALKATFVLIPLFGIQWGFVIHRPAFTLWFEVTRVVIQYSQGAIVSLVFCVFNGEVHTHLKGFLRIHWPGVFKEETARFQNTMSGTQYTVVSSGRRSQLQNDRYIPLSTVPDDKLKSNGDTG